MYGTPPQPFGPPPPRSKKPWWKRKRVIVVGVAAFLVVGAINGADGDTDAKTPPTAQVSTAEAEVVEKKSAAQIAAEDEAERAAQAEKAAQEEAERLAAEEARVAEEEREAEEARLAEEAEAAEEARAGTVSQQNAYESALSYLDFAAFSRAGLLDQLTSEYGEGYPVDDAEFAIVRLEDEGAVDWNAEAAEAAKNYLEFTSFSRAGLIDQLTSEYGEQFTPKQAKYGVDQTGL